MVLHFDCKIEWTPEHEVNSVPVVRGLEYDRPKRKIEGGLEPECKTEVNTMLRCRSTGSVELGAELLGESIETNV